MEPAIAPKLGSGCIIEGIQNQRGNSMMMTKGQKKVGKVMSEFKSGKLHSGGTGKVVKNPQQAIAIALSEAKIKQKPKKGMK